MKGKRREKGRRKEKGKNWKERRGRQRNGRQKKTGRVGKNRKREERKEEEKEKGRTGKKKEREKGKERRTTREDQRSPRHVRHVLAYGMAGLALRQSNSRRRLTVVSYRFSR